MEKPTRARPFGIAPWCSLALPAPSVAPSSVALNVEDLEKATEGLGVTIRDLPIPGSPEA